MTTTPDLDPWAIANAAQRHLDEHPMLAPYEQTHIAGYDAGYRDGYRAGRAHQATDNLRAFAARIANLVTEAPVVPATAARLGMVTGSPGGAPSDRQRQDHLNHGRPAA